MTSLSISGSSGSEGVTSGPVRKPDAKGGVANLSPMAIEKIRISPSSSYGHGRQSARKTLSKRPSLGGNGMEKGSTGNCRG